MGGANPGEGVLQERVRPALTLLGDAIVKRERLRLLRAEDGGRPLNGEEFAVQEG